MDWSLRDVELDFLKAMEEAGVPLGHGERLVLDGRARLYHIEGDKKGSKRGRYKVFCDGSRPAGWFKTYAHGGQVFKWVFRRDDEPAFSPEERERWVREAEAARQARAKDEAKSQAEAMRSARMAYDAATDPDPQHPYLVRKGILPHVARQLGRDLVIPLCDASGTLKTIQKILPGKNANGTDKIYQPGAPKWGAFCVLPGVEAKPAEGVEGVSAAKGGARMMWVAEGFATAATLAEASGQPSVMACDAGNLMPVARALREKHPGLLLVLAPDWDRSAGNTGMARALEVREELGLPLVPPRFAPEEQGSDWNDFCALHGLEATREALRQGLKEALGDPQVQALREEHLYPHLTEQGKPKKTIANLEALMGWLGVACRYNEIRKEVEFEVPGADYGVDNVLNAATAWVTSKCAEHGLPLGANQVGDYLLEIAARNPYNPVREWIASRPWDGQPRIPALIETLHTVSTFPEDLKVTLVTAWLISAVAAVFTERGFSARGVLVLQGPQAAGKTSWFRALVPRESGWFGEGMVLDPAEKDSLKLFVSHWIVELGELEGTFRRADLARLKAFITRGTDLVRLPWARKMSEYPRRTVLCASVNQREVLLDGTGNSRWWCLPLESVDYRHRLDMQQVWAEAAERWGEGQQWWLDPEQERQLEEQNREFEVPDPVEDALASKLDWGAPRDGWTQRTATEILAECGIDRPVRAQTIAAGIYLHKATGLESVRVGKERKRVILAPPKRWAGASSWS